MGQHRAIAGVNPAPVRTAVTHQTGLPQCKLAQGRQISVDIQYSKNRTHNKTLRCINPIPDLHDTFRQRGMELPNSFFCPYH